MKKVPKTWQKTADEFARTRGVAAPTTRQATAEELTQIAEVSARKTERRKPIPYYLRKTRGIGEYNPASDSNHGGLARGRLARRERDRAMRGGKRG